MVLRAVIHAFPEPINMATIHHGDMVAMYFTADKSYDNNNVRPISFIFQKVRHLFESIRLRLKWFITHNEFDSRLTNGAILIC